MNAQASPDLGMALGREPVAYVPDSTHLNGTHVWGSPGLTKREYAAIHMTVPDDLTIAWGEQVVGPYPSRNDSGGVVFDLAGVQWWARVEARYRRIYADALMEELAAVKP